MSYPAEKCSLFGASAEGLISYMPLEEQKDKASAAAIRNTKEKSTQFNDHTIIHIYDLYKKQTNFNLEHKRPLSFR